ncbi:DoxX family protein [Streptomyces sp. NPDC002755]
MHAHSAAPCARARILGPLRYPCADSGFRGRSEMCGRKVHTRVHLRRSAQRCARCRSPGRRIAEGPAEGKHSGAIANAGRPQRTARPVHRTGRTRCAAGLLTGLFWQPIGVAAATGFGLLLVGAVRFHAKAGDYANPETRGNAMAPAVLTAVAVAAATTLALSA